MGKPKVLLVGIDAADWNLIVPLMEKGALPTLQSLVDQGCMAHIATLEPCYSPMLWTSIATGKRADKHGILGFIEPDPGGHGMRPVLSTSRKTKALWNILAQNGLRTHVVGWWPSHPVEPLPGIMISNQYHKITDRLAHGSLPDGSVHPPELKDLFALLRVHPQELTDAHLLPFLPKLDQIDLSKDRKPGILAMRLAEAASVQAAATWAMDYQPWDFMAVYFDFIDHICHIFMAFKSGARGASEKDCELYGGVVDAAYRFFDMMLATLVSKAGPDTTVMVVSDHGFHSDDERLVALPKDYGAPAMDHRSHGIFLVRGQGIRSDALVQGMSLLNVAPTVLSLFGLPAGADMDAAPMAGIFEDPHLPAPIPSWDEVPGECAMHPQGFQADPVVARSTLQQLIDLGYVQDPGQDAVKAAETASVECQFNLARVYQGSGRSAKAMPLLQQLVDQFSQEGRFAVRLARACLDCGEYSQAQLTLERFLEESGRLLSTESNTDESVEEQKQKQSLRYWTRQAEATRIDLAMLRGDYAWAIQSWREWLSANPSSAMLRIRLAEALLAGEQTDEALGLFQQALQHDPLSSAAHNGISRVWMQKGEWERAAQAALDAISLDAHAAQNHFVLAQALLPMQSYERCALALEATLVLQPGWALARKQLLMLYKEHLHLDDKANMHDAILRGDCYTQPQNAAQLSRSPFPLVHLAEKYREPLVIVSGLPRSGTSAMMQMLSLGGMPVFTDKLRTADESNPRGYYEHEAVKNLARDNRWMDQAEGQAIKVIVQLLPFLPSRLRYRVIFMERNISEILTSQHKMLLRNGKATGKYRPTELYLSFQKQLEDAKKWLAEQPNIETIYVTYSQMVADPLAVAHNVAYFSGKSLDIAAMAAGVDATLYRERQHEAQK